MKKTLPFLVFSSCFLLLLASCSVDFSPNATWRNIPVVYCVIDPEEDTVWARVQRCYLSEDNLLQYIDVIDSNCYPEGQISVILNNLDDNSRVEETWTMTPTGDRTTFFLPINRDITATGGLWKLLVIDNPSGDTLATGTTTLVGFRDKIRMGTDTLEQVLLTPSNSRNNIFGYRTGCRGEIKWNTVPQGRRYQPILTFYYRKHEDTLSIQIPGATINDAGGAAILNSYSISQNRLLSFVRNALIDNRDTLHTVDHVDITIAVANEDLNAYIASQEALNTSQENYLTYTNIEGGYGIFASRRTHITTRVPCDSVGKPGYLPFELKNLHVGFSGDWGK